LQVILRVPTFQPYIQTHTHISLSLSFSHMYVFMCTYIYMCIYIYIYNHSWLGLAGFRFRGVGLAHSMGIRDMGLTQHYAVKHTVDGFYMGQMGYL
jgi:hypothetical protein